MVASIAPSLGCTLQDRCHEMGGIAHSLACFEFEQFYITEQLLCDGRSCILYIPWVALSLYSCILQNSFFM